MQLTSRHSKAARVLPGLVAAALCASAAGAALLATSAASRAQEQAAREKKTLEQRVADLEEQVAALRRDVAAAPPADPSATLTYSYRLQQPRLALPSPNGQQVMPPDSRPFAFNGYTYYWVPLGTGETPPVVSSGGVVTAAAGEPAPGTRK